MCAAKCLTLEVEEGFGVPACEGRHAAAVLWRVGKLVVWSLVRWT